jgi:hypothetical protein
MHLQCKCNALALQVHHARKPLIIKRKNANAMQMHCTCIASACRGAAEGSALTGLALRLDRGRKSASCCDPRPGVALGGLRLVRASLSRLARQGGWLPSTAGGALL